jgi:conjugative relaxase-like TrwC/TraI family protein
VKSTQTIKAGSKAQKHYYSLDCSISQPEQVLSAQNEFSLLTQAIWLGRDAARLGLVGHAKQVDVEQIFDGTIPNSGERIRQQKPRADHRENLVHDLVLSCKKSVSLQIHLGGDLQVFGAAHKAALEVAELIEHDYAQIRVQTAGKRRVTQTDGLIILLMPHHTTRSADPGVHFHLLIANGSISPDGKWRALYDRGFSHAYYLGDYFSARLATHIQHLGYQIRPTNTASGQPSWEIEGYSDTALKTFSKRSENKRVGALISQGYSRDQALLVTRPSKDKSEPLEISQLRWQIEAANHDIKPVKPQYVAPTIKYDKSAKDLLESAIRHYSHTAISFTRDDIRKFVYKTPWKIAVGELDHAIRNHPKLIDYGIASSNPKLEGRYTTLEALQREIQTIQAWRQGQGHAQPILDRKTAGLALQGVNLKSGQREAIIGVVASQNKHQIIHGLSGVGKTTALRQLKAILDTQGIEILGFAPSIKAAQKLSEELSIGTNTVQKLIKSNSFNLKPNQLLVIDEAGMVSASMMQILLAKANDAGARVLLVGDTGQNQAIEAGSPMRSLMAHGVEVHHIAEIIRQKNALQRQAVELIAQGQGSQALNLLSKHGYTQEIKNREQRVKSIAEAYLSLSENEQSKTLIVTGTNAEKDAITQQIRAGLFESGRLSHQTPCTQLRDRKLSPEESFYIGNYQVGNYISLSRNYASTPLKKQVLYRVEALNGAELIISTAGGRLYRFNPEKLKDKQVFSAHQFDVAVGDSLRWTTSNKALGQINGECFQITSINGQLATAVSDEGKEFQIDLSRPLTTDYTLTSTSYRAQGTDRPRVFVSATNDPTSKREPFYVSISRQTQDLRVWTEDFDGLAQRVKQSNIQQNPLELLDSSPPIPIQESTDERTTHVHRSSTRHTRTIDQNRINNREFNQQGQPNTLEHSGDTGSIYRPLAGNIYPKASRERLRGSDRGIQGSIAGQFQRVECDGSLSDGLETGGNASPISDPELNEQIRFSKFARIANGVNEFKLCQSIRGELEGYQEAVAQFNAVCHTTSSVNLTDALAALEQSLNALEERLEEQSRDKKLTLLAEAIEHWQLDNAVRESQTNTISTDLNAFAADWQHRQRPLQTLETSFNFNQHLERFQTEQRFQIVEDNQPLRVEDYIADALKEHQSQMMLLKQVFQEQTNLPELAEMLQSLSSLIHRAEQDDQSTSAPDSKSSPTFWQPVYKQMPEGISKRHWDEFKASAIHPELVALNITSLNGEPVIDRLLSHKLDSMGSGQFVTAPMSRLISRYEQVAQGGWWGNAGVNPLDLPTLLPGQQPPISQWGCYKPDSPRIDTEKSKQKQSPQFIKYEHPLGLQRELYLPEVPEKLAEQIYAKFGLSPSPEEKESGFWYVVYLNPQLPITITEGLKKTLSSLSQGEITIGVSGVNGIYKIAHQDNGKIPKRQLEPGLAVFAAQGREIRFAFDQDIRPKTVENVRRELVRGVEVLEDRGCTCKVLQWRPEEGKGLDDLIAKKGPQAYAAAQENAIPAQQEKKVHYQTQYQKLSRSAFKDNPELAGMQLDAAIYRLAIQRGEIADGERFIGQSPVVKQLNDHELIRFYTAEVRATAKTLAFLSIPSPKEQEVYHALAQKIDDHLPDLPYSQKDALIYRWAEENGWDGAQVLLCGASAQKLRDNPRQLRNYLHQNIQLAHRLDLSEPILDPSKVTKINVNHQVHHLQKGFSQ